MVMAKRRDKTTEPPDRPNTPHQSPPASRSCQKCGSTDLEPRGEPQSKPCSLPGPPGSERALTRVIRQRMKCRKCGQLGMIRTYE